MIGPDAPALSQVSKWFANFVWTHPAVYRTVAPWRRWRMPSMAASANAGEDSTKPVALFFYPADKWDKKSALAVGQLGHLYRPIGRCQVQIGRGLVGSAASVSEVHYWGAGMGYGVVKNLVSGVNEGFAVNLELHGIGFRAEADTARNKLVLKIGFSHDVEVELNDGTVMFNVLSPQLVQVAGLDYAAVHQAAARVRSFRPPDKYKGKGLRYQREEVRLKEAKKG